MAKPILDFDLRKGVNSGSNTLFWHHKWTSLGTIISCISRSLNINEDSSLVNQVLDENKKWDWSSLSFDLRRSITDNLQATPLNLSSYCDDS